MAQRREIMKEWVEQVIRSNGGSATILDISKEVWANREQEIRSHGDLLYM